MSDVAAVVKSTDGSPLAFPDERQQRFELGVCLVLHNWEDLTTAVDNGWGGPESEDKRDWLAGSIVELFEQDYVDSDDIEDRLLNVMEDEFDVSIEDGTSLPVAVNIISLYQQCAANDFTKLDKMYEQFQERQKNKTARIPVSVQNEDGADDESDSGESEVDEQSVVYEEVTEQEQQSREPVVDEDGFELVQRKRR